MWDPKLRNNSLDFASQINPDPALILRTLDAAVSVSPAQLAAQPPGTVVALRAVVHPGPQGLLRAPLSGAQCVWHRSVVVPGWGYTAVPDIGASDSTPVLEAGTPLARRRLRPSEEISTAPFLVGEQGAGAVLVDPLVADVHLDDIAIDEVRRPKRIETRALVREWVLEPGTRVLVVGRTGADGRLHAADDAALLVTTFTEEQVRARCEASWSRFSHHVGGTVIRTERFTAKVRRIQRYVLAGLIVVSVLVVLVFTLVN